MCFKLATAVSKEYKDGVLVPVTDLAHYLLFCEFVLNNTNPSNKLSVLIDGPLKGKEFLFTDVVFNDSIYIVDGVEKVTLDNRLCFKYVYEYKVDSSGNINFVRLHTTSNAVSLFNLLDNKKYIYTTVNNGYFYIDSYLWCKRVNEFFNINNIDFKFKVSSIDELGSYVEVDNIPDIPRKHLLVYCNYSELYQLLKNVKIDLFTINAFSYLFKNSLTGR